MGPQPPETGPDLRQKRFLTIRNGTQDQYVQQYQVQEARHGALPDLFAHVLQDPFGGDGRDAGLFQVQRALPARPLGSTDGIGHRLPQGAQDLLQQAQQRHHCHHSGHGKARGAAHQGHDGTAL